MSSHEESKLSDPQLQPHQPIQWFWQSDLDPWKEKDPNRWIWTPYSHEHSDLIEYHFLDFLVKRTYETYSLFQRLKELDLNCKQNQYQDAIQAVIQCIQKAAEYSQRKIVKSKGLLNLKSPIDEAKNIVNEIETKSSNPDFTLRDFLKLVLRVSSMESFICYWLNELLRKEKFNVFIPYLVCLAYAFQVKDFIVPEPQGLMVKFSSVFSAQNLILYRGTVMVKEHLKLYQFDNTRLFLWDGVISTSRSREQALKFVQLSLKKVKPGDKIGVLFIIEADLASVTGREGIINISKDSKFPSEEEVKLAPSSVFSVLGLQYNQVSNIYEVRLELKKKFKKKNKISGDLKGRIVCENKAVLSGLNYEEIIQALNLLENNQFLSGLKIEKCVLDSYLVGLIGSMAYTIKIKRRTLKLRIMR